MAELSGSDLRRTSAPSLSALGAATAPVAQALTHPVLVVFFVLALLQPFRVFIGPMLLNGHRMLLLLVAVPIMLAFLRGKAGRILLPDVLMVGFTLWTLICIFNGQGLTVDSFVLWGSQTALEAMIPYFLARIIIRTKEDFIFLARCVVISILVLLPFAILEAVLRVSPLIKFYQALPGLYVYPNVQYPPRLGMSRAQSVFEHPILFGLYCTLGFSFAIMTLRLIGVGAFGRTWRAIGTVAGTFFSLSSGALAATMVQLLLILYDKTLWFLKARWKVILWLAIAGYVALTFLIESNPLLYIISKATFSGHTAWTRVAIFDYGIDEVVRNPILGMGMFEDWIRPAWMHATSVDNFWLLMAMRYGIPGFALLLGIFLSMMMAIWRRDFSHDPDMGVLRKSYLFTLAGLFVTLATVHVWGAPYVFVVFLLGAGSFFLAPDAMATAPQSPPQNPEQKASTGTAKRSPRTRRARAYARATPEETSAHSTSAPEASRRASPRHSSEQDKVYTRFPGGKARKDQPRKLRKRQPHSRPKRDT